MKLVSVCAFDTGSDKSLDCSSTLQRKMHAIGSNIPCDELLKFDVKSICTGGRSISVKVGQVITALDDVEEADLGGKRPQGFSVSQGCWLCYRFVSKIACFPTPE
jgi:hypothetical protein